jgi:predicted nucleic acid-binding protein
VLILDTNVLSEVLRPAPHDGVLAWLGAQPRSQVFTTAITRAEILFGVALLDKGSRRQKLLHASQAIFDEDLEGKVIAFDETAAGHYADIAVYRKQIGRPITQLDAMIAAIARTHQASIATRNVMDFFDCGIEVIDPWKS